MYCIFKLHRLTNEDKLFKSISNFRKAKFESGPQSAFLHIKVKLCQESDVPKQFRIQI